MRHSVFRWIIRGVLACAVAIGAMTLASVPANAAVGNTCGQLQPAGASNLYGWLVTDTSANYARCGTLVPQWDLTSWYDIPYNNTMWICASPYLNSPQSVGFTPTGQTQESFGQCNYPFSINPGQNLMQVRRTSVGAPFIEPNGIINPINNPGYNPTVPITRGGTVTIFGVDFYPGDQVLVNGQSATVTYDSLTLGQINAILPPSVSGAATVVVKNGFGESSAGTQIVIH